MPKEQSFSQMVGHLLYAVEMQFNRGGNTFSHDFRRELTESEKSELMRETAYYFGDGVCLTIEDNGKVSFEKNSTYRPPNT